jgi:hypothetical protein
MCHVDVTPRATFGKVQGGESVISGLLSHHLVNVLEFKTLKFFVKWQTDVLLFLINFSILNFVS